MSSSNGGLSSATNGRSGSTGSANINLNLKGHERSIGGAPGSGASSATTTSITHKTLPDLKTQRSNSACHAHESLSALRRIALLEKPPEKLLSYGAAQSRILGQEAREDFLVYSEGRLHSGPLQSLIAHMVPTHEYYPDEGFIFAFLLSARLFVRPHELLAQISQTWEHQQQVVGTGGDVVDDAGQVPGRTMMLSINSASPLTQRKGSAAAASHSSELEPRLQQRTNTQRSAQHCIRLLSEWIEIFPYDFRDERLMQQVRILARKCVYIDNSLGKQVSRILQLLVSRLTTLEQYEEFLQTISSEEAQSQQQQHHHHGHHNHLHNAFQTFLGSSSHANGASGGGGSASGTSNSSSSGHTSSASTSNSISTTPQPDDVFGIMDMCPSCAHLAHQLTSIELERLSHIGPEEFVQAFAKDYQQQAKDGSKEANKSKCSGGGGGSLNDMKKTRNLESYVQWFNRLSYLTASEIVKYPKKKQRVRIIEYWIETARECFNIGNFNSLMAIIAGLNLAPIGRLKKTWSKVQSAKFSVLEHQMDPTSNFNSYRSTLKAAMWRSEGATEERERIIIPFFSLFVKDLYFLNEGCSNRLPNNHINFEKCSQLAKQVMEFNEWKKVNCPFEKLPNVIAYLQHSAVLNENTLSMASFECEPPENTEEKDRYRTVKAETKQQLLQQLQDQHQQSQ
ncbi:ras-GEF domain-containing family member 1C [Drosophila mauritiana]|uniref:Ras-GEF domain-containing family member 1C n=1 Tax=Drosophila mauritiana TaxID=7226 RepID=A0A6P8JS44_DROMA|nr:ras-GEF domain-containing family member 1C [Drosophila mauritiana]XP_033158913.1 ras-GEF domain-containing family member 1C [Drosophila mauritiana]